MRAVKLLVVAVLAFVVLAVPTVVFADGRVALVVGNSTYANIGRLPNPENDAADISAALRRLGFEVTTEFDADRVELTEALRAFTRQSAGADVSLVFYAGHGIEMDGVNYLVPVDARLERDVRRALRTGDAGRPAGVDTGGVAAARGSPMPAGTLRWPGPNAAAPGSTERERRQLRRPRTKSCWATRRWWRMRGAAGTTAADGRGRNSPYTAALLSHLKQPLEIGLLFRPVRAHVLSSTNGQQRPHEYQSLVGEHYLAGAPATEAVAVNALATTAPAPDVAPVDVDQLDVVGLRLLAERGDARAQTAIGQRYEAGRGVEADYVTAVSWYQRAAQQGDARAQAFLGFMYNHGRGVARDVAEAVRWYRRSAEQGNALGQNNLGVMYRDGRGVTRDYGEAVAWFRRSAEQGNVRGRTNLGAMYRDGRGVSRDDEEALRWFRRAASDGYALAQNNLGWMYENGRGVQRDRVEAVRWYRRAADKGDSWAQDQLDRLR